MFRQITKIIVMFSLMAGVAVFFVLMLLIPLSNYQGAWYHMKALSVGAIQKKIEVEPHFWATVSHERYANATTVPTSKVLRYTAPHVNVLKQAALQNTYRAILISLITSFGLIIYFLARGMSSKNKKHISGNKLSSPFWLQLRLILSRQTSPIKIGPVPMIKGTETQHTLITGGTGSGKTNCLFHILKQIRSQNQKAVVVDTTGDFLNRTKRTSELTRWLLLEPLKP